MNLACRENPFLALMGVGLLLGLSACATDVPVADSQTLSPQRISAIVASPDRSAADRGNDVRRMPEPMLAFIGIRPGMVVLDLSAGRGYTTELLARATGSTGMVYGQSQPRDANRAPATVAVPEGNSNPSAQRDATGPVQQPGVPITSAVALAQRNRELQSAGVSAAPIVAVEQRFEDPVPAALAQGRLDLVTLMFNYHDLVHLGVDRTQMNRAVFRALKPGGVYVIADHSGRPGSGGSETATLHRIEESYLRSEVEAAGFRLLASADFLRNPADPRDRNTPYPPQPKDEFVLKFVKPR